MTFSTNHLSNSILNIIFEYDEEDLMNLSFVQLSKLNTLIENEHSKLEILTFPYFQFLTIIVNKVSQIKINKLTQIFPNEKFHSKSDNNFARLVDYSVSAKDLLADYFYAQAKYAEENKLNALKDLSLKDLNFYGREEKHGFILDLMEIFTHINPNSAIDLFEYFCQRMNGNNFFKAELLIIAGLPLNYQYHGYMFIQSYLHEVIKELLFASRSYHNRNINDNLKDKLSFLFELIELSIANQYSNELIEKYRGYFYNFIYNLAGWCLREFTHHHIIEWIFIPLLNNPNNKQLILENIHRKFNEDTDDYDPHSWLSFITIGALNIDNHKSYQSLIHNAAELNCFDVIEHLIKIQLPNIDKLILQPNENKNNKSAFQQLIIRPKSEEKLQNQAAALQKLLQSFPKIIEEKLQFDPVKLAIRNVNAQAIKILLSAGFSLNFELLTNFYFESNFEKKIYINCYGWFDFDDEALIEYKKKFHNCLLSACDHIKNPDYRRKLFYDINGFLLYLCQVEDYSTAAILFEKFPEILETDELHDKFLEKIHFSRKRESEAYGRMHQESSSRHVSKYFATDYDRIFLLKQRIGDLNNIYRYLHQYHINFELYLQDIKHWHALSSSEKYTLLSVAIIKQDYNFALTIIAHGAQAQSMLAWAIQQGDNFMASGLITVNPRIVEEYKKPHAKCTTLLKSFAKAKMRLKTQLSAEFTQSLTQFNHLDEKERLCKLMKLKQKGIFGSLGFYAKESSFLEYMKYTKDLKHYIQKAIHSELSNDSPDIFFLSKLLYWQSLTQHQYNIFNESKGISAAEVKKSENIPRKSRCDAICNMITYAPGLTFRFFFKRNPEYPPSNSIKPKP